MNDVDRRRRALEAIIASDDATPEQFLRAAELLDRLDERDPDATTRDFYSDLEKLTPDERAELDAEIMAPTYEEIVNDDRFAAEVARAARNLADVRRKRSRRKRRDADVEAVQRESRGDVPASGSEADSVPQNVVRLTPPPGIFTDLGWGREPSPGTRTARRRAALRALEAEERERQRRNT